MNSQFIVHGGQERYYKKLSQEYKSLNKEDNYYTRSECPSYFSGSGAKHFSIDGVNINSEKGEKALGNLFKGFSPDGNTQCRKNGNTTRFSYAIGDEHGQPILDPNTNRELRISKFEASQIKCRDTSIFSRNLTKLIETYKLDYQTITAVEKKFRPVCAYDNVFSAPKDVSVLWSQAPDRFTQQKIERCHAKAIEEAKKYLESQTLVRTGTAGVQHNKAKPIFAQFEHKTSRAGDPQLHTHLLMLNIGITDEEKAGALDGQRILKARYTSGMIYLNTLRYEMEKGLGVRTFDIPFRDNKGIGFGIDGVTNEIKLGFSRRWLEIQKHTTPLMSGKETRAKALKCRPDKVRDTPTKDMEAEWRRRGAEMGFKWEKVVNYRYHDDKPAQKLFLREVSTHLSFKEQRAVEENEKRPDKIQFLTQQQIMNAVLAASKGQLTQKEVESQANEYLENYTQKVEVTHKIPIKIERDGKLCDEIKEVKRSFYQLNEKTTALMKYRTVWETVKATIQWYRDYRKFSKRQERRKAQAKFKRKVTWLYAVGRISRKQYQELTAKENKNLNKSVFTLRVYQTFGLMSKRQVDGLIAQKKYNTQHQKQLITFESKLQRIDATRLDHAAEINMEKRSFFEKVWREDNKLIKEQDTFLSYRKEIRFTDYSAAIDNAREESLRTQKSKGRVL